MKPRIRWLDSLKNRAATVIVLVIVITVLSATVFGTLASQSELEDQARQQVATLANVVTSGIDDKLAQRFDAISHTADNLRMEAESFRGRAQLLIEREMALASLFRSLHLIGAEGRIIAGYPKNSGAIGLDVSDRPYFKKTSQQLTTLVSKPIIGRRTGEALVMITAPVFDFRKRMTGILAGTIQLSQKSLLGQVASMGVEGTGQVSVVTHDGMILAHPDAGQIYSMVAKDDPVMVHARASGEGTRRSTNRRGQAVLVSYAQLDEAPWFVMVSLPVDEAFAPIHRLQSVFLWMAVVLIALLGAASLGIFRRLLAPLSDLSEQIAGRHEGRRQQPVAVGGGREIRRVANTFNKVMAQREAAEAALAKREAYFRSLTDWSPIGIVQTDVYGRIEFANTAFEKIIGASVSQLENRLLFNGLHDDDRSALEQAWPAILHEGKVYEADYRAIHHNGRLIWISAMTTTIESDAEVLGTISVVRDITHEREVEAELEAARTRAENILAVMNDGVVLTDLAGQITYANDPACQFLQCANGLVGKRLFESACIEVDGHPLTLEDVLLQPHVDSVDAVMPGADAQNQDVELTVLRLNRDQATEQLVFVFRDDSERRRHEERLTWEAGHDSLTRLANRRTFNRDLTALIEQYGDSKMPTALIMIDLDHFKPVNDNGGHLVGDELLIQLAGCLKSSVRQSDLVARLGGDEFGVILPACGIERATVIAESIRAAVEKVIVNDAGQRYGVTASMGLTVLAESDREIKTVVARADEGAYAAKSEGRNRVITVAALQRQPALISSCKATDQNQEPVRSAAHKAQDPPARNSRKSPCG